MTRFSTVLLATVMATTAALAQNDRKQPEVMSVEKAYPNQLTENASPGSTKHSNGSDDGLSGPFGSCCRGDAREDHASPGGGQPASSIDGEVTQFYDHATTRFACIRGSTSRRCLMSRDSHPSMKIRCVSSSGMAIAAIINKAHSSIRALAAVGLAPVGCFDAWRSCPI